LIYPRLFLHSFCSL